MAEDPESWVEILARLDRQGAERHPAWKSELFRAYAAGPAARLWATVGMLPESTAVLTGYMRLVQEGIGAGWVHGLEPASLVERCLAEVVPASLGAIGPGGRLEALAQAWNLLEGLRADAWLERWVHPMRARLERLADLPGFLARVLAPVVEPAPAPAWEGPMQLAVLRVEQAHRGFLPGPMHLARAGIACVHDRRLAGLQVGVALPRGGPARLLGVGPCQGTVRVAGPGPGRPIPTVADGVLTAGAQRVALPGLREAREPLASVTGQVAVAAVDSQWLWTVASP